MIVETLGEGRRWSKLCGHSINKQMAEKEPIINFDVGVFMEADQNLRPHQLFGVAGDKCTFRIEPLLQIMWSMLVGLHTTVAWEVKLGAKIDIFHRKALSDASWMFLRER